MIQRQFILLFFSFLFTVFVVEAQYKIPEKPKFQTSVYDYINLLTKEQKNSLEKKLISYSDTTSTQMVIVIIPSTEGENIAYLAANWGEKWGIGQKEKDNGILILLSKKDRKVTIASGKVTEGKLTDLMSTRIIESRMIPEFKMGNFYKGLNKGADGIFEVLTGEFKESKKRRPKQKESDGWGFFPFLIILILIIIFGNRGGRWRRRSAAGVLLDAVILSSLGRAGSSSGGSFGGGGFSGGFGGGSFGGGGATGSW